jgi:hypothetical protein
MNRRPTRIIEAPRAGLQRERTAPFWIGDTAEQIVRARKQQYEQEKAAKAAARLRKKRRA